MNEPMHRGKEMTALLLAASVTRNGGWIKGAPTHVLAELLQALEERGWKLVHEADMTATARRVLSEDLGPPSEASIPH